MIKPIKEAISYAGSVADRTIGRSAWKEGMREFDLAMQASFDDKLPAGVRVTFGVLGDLLVSMRASSQAVLPISYSNILRHLYRSMDNPETSLLGKKSLSPRESFSFIVTPLLSIAGELALVIACSRLSNNYGEFVGLLMARNVVTHVGLDAAEVVGRGAARVFRHFRPSTTAAV